MDRKSKSFLTLGVDLGGTKIETALVDAEGKIVAGERSPTRCARGPESVILDIIQGAKNYLDHAGQKVHSLGIGVAGQVDKETGAVLFAPNLRWRKVQLQEKLEQALEMPVEVNNDVRAATWSEWKYGAGEGADDLLCLFVGTGIGGGIVSGGNLLEGCLNTAGELGHVPIVAGGRKCHCRNRGCLEAYASGWATKERAQEVVGNDPSEGKRLIQLAGSLEKISARTVREAFYLGDPLARHLVEETAEFMAVGITGFVNAFNPCRVVLGGGVITGLPEYIAMIEHKVRERALAAAVEKLSFAPASLGDKSVVIGAAMMAYHKVLKGSASY